MLISTTQLNSILEKSNILVIDTRSFNDYSEGHIPGAVNLDLFAFHWIDTTKEGVQNFNNQAEMIFSFAGVNSEKKVIFYDNISGMLAARGVW
ncbi:MAG: sulfurtransferase, partial [Nitrosopumilus sp.]|nr:sulfurtransferase [Nitrosopumilus sp.]